MKSRSRLSMRDCKRCQTLFQPKNSKDEFCKDDCKTWYKKSVDHQYRIDGIVDKVRQWEADEKAKRIAGLNGE